MVQTGVTVKGGPPSVYCYPCYRVTVRPNPRHCKEFGRESTVTSWVTSRPKKCYPRPAVLEPRRSEQSVGQLLMPEVPHAGEHHRQPVLVAGLDGILIAH
jgi:hypothetical protein